MTWLSWLGGVLLILFLLGQIKIGVAGAYQAGEISLWGTVALLRIQILPKKGKPSKSKEPKQKPEKQKSEKLLSPWDFLHLAQSLVPTLLESVRRLHAILVVDQLVFHMTIPGANDPAGAGIRYGQASGALGALWVPLTQGLHVKNGDAGIQVDFESEDLTAEGKFSLSVKLGQLLCLACYLGWHALGRYLTVRNEAKARKVV